MGLCSSATVKHEKDNVYRANDEGPDPIVQQSDPNEIRRRESNNVQAESKLGVVFKSKRTRKKVVMEATEDGATVFTQRDLEKLQKTIADKTTKETDWLVKVLSSEFFMFNEMEQVTQAALVNVMERLTTFTSDVIITQGDIGDYMYIVQEGAFDVYVNDAKVGNFGKDIVFGELALLYDAPRAATIKVTSTDTVLWRIGRDVFKYLIRSAVQATSNQIMDTLNQVALLQPLTSDQKLQLSTALEPISFNDNDKIVNQGDSGDIFYIIKSGSVVCTDVNAEDDSTDIVLGAGEYFGELALMTSKPRARDVIACEETVCLALDRESFQKHLGDLNEILNFNQRERTLECTPLFDSLSVLEKNRLAGCLSTETFEQNDVVVKEGDVGTIFYIIVEGTLQASKNDTLVPNGQLTVGNFFGEAAILELNGERKASMVVISDAATLYSLSRENFIDVLGDTALSSLIKERSKDRLQRLSQAVIEFKDLEIHAPLGCGTFGRVFLVTDKKQTNNGQSPPQPMALKCMVKQQIVDMKMTNSINNERLIMSHIGHPFLLRLVTTFQDKDQVYMVLDYVCGGELFSRLADLHHLQFAHSRFYAACVVSAFEHLHRKEIVYRDLKPENLLIDREGYLKVVDFGFAKKLKRNEKTFTTCGTPEYLAPEIILHTGHDYLVDVYAVGILIYEMEVGESPYNDPSGKMNPSVICNQILKGKLKFPSGVNVRTQELVTALCTKNASKRLGCGLNGTKEVCEHGYFRELDFNLLEKKKYKAPWVPEIENELDTSNFDDYPFDKSVPRFTGKNKNLFKGF